MNNQSDTPRTDAALIYLKQKNESRRDLDGYSQIGVQRLIVTAKSLERKLNEARQRLATEWSKEEVEDQWTAAIEAAHPANDGADDSQVNTALEMVSHRHSKWSLVALVNWLLLEQKKTQQQLNEAVKQRDAFKFEHEKDLAEIEGWRNKWNAAVEMAARAEVRRDREANLLDMILVMAATGTDECLRLVIRQAATALAEMDKKEPV